jgi:hypothetical protein
MAGFRTGYHIHQMPPKSMRLIEEHLKRIRSAYKAAWAEAKLHGNEAMKALRNVDLARTATARKTFERQAKRALKAAENWQQAAAALAKALTSKDK